MNTPTTLTPDLKAKHRAIWASGDYAGVAAKVIPDLGAALVTASGIRAEDRVLDVGAGAGNASFPAARAGARVVASDLTPELIDEGRRQAEELGLALDWRVADAEALPFDDQEFDATISCVGVMFAPHHRLSADELVRVTRGGGTIAMANWTPTGFIGQMFATMKPFTPPPPAGVQAPPLWGDVDHLRDLFGDRVLEVDVQRRPYRVDCFATPEEFLEFFKHQYGPTIAAYRGLANEPGRADELDSALIDLATRHDLGDGSMDWEYLLYVGRTR